MNSAWKCLWCGGTNSASSKVCGCGMHRNAPPPEKCSSCGRNMSIHSNHCPYCGKSFRSSRLEGKSTYPRTTEPPSVMCYEAKSNGTLVVATPDPNAERLYIVGPGDVLTVMGEEKEFYRLRLPGDEIGYAAKQMGRLLEVGLGEVEEPLGYVRLIQGINQADIVAVQPDGRKDEVLYQIDKEERFPIVEEREYSFLVQLPNKRRGWIAKNTVIRTLSPQSLPVDIPSGGGALASALGIGALVGGALLASALAGDPEEQRIRRGVDRALRDRGM